METGCGSENLRVLFGTCSVCNVSKPSNRQGFNQAVKVSQDLQQTNLQTFQVKLVLNIHDT